MVFVLAHAGHWLGNLALVALPAILISVTVLALRKSGN